MRAIRWSLVGFLGLVLSSSASAQLRWDTNCEGIRIHDREFGLVLVDFIPVNLTRVSDIARFSYAVSGVSGSLPRLTQPVLQIERLDQRQVSETGAPGQAGYRITYWVKTRISSATRFLDYRAVFNPASGHNEVRWMRDLTTFTTCTEAQTGSSFDP